MFSKRERRRNIGSVMIGFAVLMFGMNIMSESVETAQKCARIHKLFVIFEKIRFLSIIVGCILTAIIQSSSASVGILQALSATGAVTFGSAITDNHGSAYRHMHNRNDCRDRNNQNRKKSIVIHLYFNVIGTIICTIVFLHAERIPEVSILWIKTIDTFQIAIVHTLFQRDLHADAAAVRKTA